MTKFCSEIIMDDEITYEAYRNVSAIINIYDSELCSFKTQISNIRNLYEKGKSEERFAIKTLVIFDDKKFTDEDLDRKSVV